MRSLGQWIYGGHIMAPVQNESENREDKPQPAGSGETRLLASVEKPNKDFPP